MPLGDIDPNSPTYLLQKRLSDQGLPLTAENMRRLLTANAYGSAEVPSVRNYAPSADPQVGGSGNVAGKIERAPRGGLPVPPRPPRQDVFPVDESGTFDQRKVDPTLMTDADKSANATQDATVNKKQPTDSKTT